MSKKNPRAKKAKAERAKRATEAPTKTADVIQLPDQTTSDQAAGDPTTNTQSADELVVEQTTIETPQVSYDLSGKGDDLMDDTQAEEDRPTKSPTNEEMALEAARAAAALEDDTEPFWTSLANIKVDFKTPFLAGCSTVWKFLKPGHDAVVNGWMWLTDKVIEPAVDKFYAWCNKHIPKMPNFVTVAQLKTLTATLADVFAEVSRDNRVQNATVLNELNELKQQVKLLTNAVNGKHPMTIPAQALNELFDLIRVGKKAQAATRYVQLTGSTLAVAREFVGSVSIA
jgi:hypothetical protein